MAAPSDNDILTLFDAVDPPADSRRAVWEQIYRHIRQLILDGRLASGERLPGEVHMSDRLGVTRVTLRRALKQLQQEGLLNARKGVGIFVRRPAGRYSVADGRKFSELFEADGGVVTTETLSLKKVRACREDAGILGVDPGDPLIEVRRLRLIDGEPFFFNTKRFPAVLFGDFERHYRKADSVSDVYAAHGIDRFERLETRIFGGFATPDEADALNLTPDTPLLYSRTLNVEPGGRCIEFSSGCWSLTSVEFVFRRD